MSESVDVAAARALVAEATAGPWMFAPNTHGDPYVAVWGSPVTRRIAQVWTSPEDYGRADAEFIAASRELIPALLDALEAAEQRAQELQDRLTATADAGEFERADCDICGREGILAVWVDDGEETYCRVCNSGEHEVKWAEIERLRVRAEAAEQRETQLRTEIDAALSRIDKRQDGWQYTANYECDGTLINWLKRRPTLPEFSRYGSWYDAEATEAEAADFYCEYCGSRYDRAIRCYVMRECDGREAIPGLAALLGASRGTDQSPETSDE